MWSRCSVVGWMMVVGCRPETPPKDTPYKKAAETFAYAYCDLAFADGCSVPDDCGIPAGFDSKDDCEFRLVPFMRACYVPEAEADPVVEALNACEAQLETATCDASLCDGGVLSVDPCVHLFETLYDYCTFEGL